MQGRQKGFTLIELIVVIMILGILAATALPKFINFSKDARASVLTGIQGAAASAAVMAYGKAAATKGVDLSAASATVKINNVDTALVYGYPSSSAIDTLLQDRGDAKFTSTASLGTWTLNGSATCTLTYTPPAKAGDNPIFATSTDGC